jgi:DNA-binding MarR family transcriptional regulator
MPVPAEAVSDLFDELHALARSLKAVTVRLASPRPDRLSLSTLLLLSQVDSVGEVRCSALAEQMGVDTSVVSRQLALLEAAGLTGRRADPQDGRAWLAHVTETGAERLAELRESRVALVTGAMSDWTEQEVRQLSGQLLRLDEALQQALHESDPATRSTRKVHA